MWNQLRARISRLRFVWSRRRLSDEAAEELRLHLELLTARYRDAGMTPEAARLAAKRQLGNVALVQEDIRRMNSLHWLDVLLQDVRYACRTFARNPAFAAVVASTLALGIGANTAMLSVAHAILLKPLPYHSPEQIYAAQVVIPERRQQLPSLPPTVQTYLRWRSTRTVFSSMAAMTPWEANVVGDGDPVRLGGARVSANFFSFLGAPIGLGRTFAAEEEQPGKEQVVVISDGLWRARYGADPAIIGRSIVVNGTKHVVIGVAPPSLLVPTGSQLHALLPFAPRIDIWKPVAPTPNMLKGESWDHGVLVRLSDASQAGQGRRELAAILTDVTRIQMPRVKTIVDVELVPIREVYAGRARLRVLLIVAASGLLLLTACASVANVFLARLASRANEMATRIALGAGRARIWSHALTETVLLALLGGAVGVAIAKSGVTLLALHGPEDVRILADTHLNATFLLFAVLASLSTGIVCGIVPAWQACRKDPGAELKDAGRTTVGRRAGRSREVLVGVEMALATVLLTAAGLLLHSFINLLKTDRGYEVERVLTAHLSLFGERYAAGEARVAFYRGLLENVRSLPAVVAAGAISDLPALAGSTGASRAILHPTDTDFPSVVLARPVAMIRGVTSGYFGASGTQLRAGRLLGDVEGAPIAVISESLARRMWPGDSLHAVIGRQFRQGNLSAPLITIAGVVADAFSGGLEREPPPVVYRPYEQWASGPMTIVVRTAQDPAILAAAVRAEIWKMDSNLPIADMRTMKEIVSSSLAERRFQVTLTTLFAVAALLLGALGTYGVVSYSVASRVRDIGVRMALGALRGDVMRWVFATGMRPVLVGLASGLMAAILIARMLRSLLFEVDPADPLALGTVVFVLLATSGVACYLPARRAARMDAVTALRHG